MSVDDLYDLVIIGGGINGAGIARDAAGRGLRVILAEKNDLASGTSSASSKLIHGGLRYLEHYEFRLVRKALAEREVLMKSAPHIIFPMKFVLPHAPHLRPAWLLRLGLFLYDHIGGRGTLPASRGVNFLVDPVGRSLKDNYTKGFAYSDCWADDARLVVLNAMDAAARGADILTRTQCSLAHREDGFWHVKLTGKDGAVRRVVRARALVNAAGPWAEEVLTGVIGKNVAGHRLRLVKGSHIVVPRMVLGDQAYILQHVDGRIVFVLPYQKNFSLIGTTDVNFTGDPGAATISDDEVTYLCETVNRYFKRSIAPKDVVSHFSGVRALYGDMDEDASEISRDYVLDLDGDDDGSVLLNVYGGKITTHRLLSEHALAKLAPWLNNPGKPWTAHAILPGGDFQGGDRNAFIQNFRYRYDWLPTDLAERYATSYGTLADLFLEEAQSLEDLGDEIGEGLYEAELRYLVTSEWARTAQDVLWRRTKLGLTVSPRTQVKLEAWLALQGARLAG